MEYVKCSLKFHYKVVVEAKGMASRLCIMWKKGISASQMEFEKNLIVIKISGAICEWLLVGFYGSPYHSKKKKARENLTALLEANQGLWVCMGDFNYTINDDKRKGARKVALQRPTTSRISCSNLVLSTYGTQGANLPGQKGNGAMLLLRESWTSE